MSLESKRDHFEGKSVADHLREARAKGRIASGEVHGAQMPAHLSFAANAAKETAFLLALLLSLLQAFWPQDERIFIFTSFLCLGWMLWKGGRSAHLGWARLERLHRLMEQERSEIAHNRKEEREELTALYRAKGFQGKLLEQVIDTLMADDNRLLHVMLEEEMGLALESYEHPLKQAIGAMSSAIVCSALILLGYSAAGMMGVYLTAGAVFVVAGYLIAKKERNEPLSAIVWSCAIGAFCLGATHLLLRYIVSWGL